jgi:uncharacterized protein (DUF1684 family)
MTAEPRRRTIVTDRETTRTPDATLSLAEWRREVADLYAEVRAMAEDDPEAAWTLWRDVRERLYRTHPQSPVPPPDRGSFRAHHWPYDPALRFAVPLLPDDAAGSGSAAEASGAIAGGDLQPAGSGGLGLSMLQLPVSVGEAFDFERAGWVDVPFREGARRLGVYWMAGYAGGLFLPFRDATNGRETYGAGRYLLDTAKSADLGTDAAGALILDFNFAFQPSCAFDPIWSCPLAPPENRLDIRIEAGERLA